MLASLLRPRLTIMVTVFVFGTVISEVKITVVAVTDVVTVVGFSVVTVEVEGVQGGSGKLAEQ